jgi:hypothetical protein
MAAKIARLESQLMTANDNISKIADMLTQRLKGKARVCLFISSR